MKATGDALLRLDSLRVPVPASKMYTNPEDPAILRIREQLIKRMVEAPKGSMVPLQFGRVELSASCHSAVLVPVLERKLRGDFPGRFVVGLDDTGRNEWDADAGLRKASDVIGTKLLCVWQIGREYRLVGPTDPQVLATYNFVLGFESSEGAGATARELADEFRITIQAASNRLAKAAGLGVVYAVEREPVAGGGTQFRFVAVA